MDLIVPIDASTGASSVATGFPRRETISTLIELILILFNFKKKKKLVVIFIPKKIRLTNTEMMLVIRKLLRKLCI